MPFQFLSAKYHGVLDYLAAGGLIVFPFLLGLGTDSAIALWLSVAGGAGLIIYSLLTDYAYGIVKIIPFNLHLILDMSAAVAFIAAPFVLGFGTLATAYYLAQAGAVTLVVMATRRAPRPEPSV